MAADLSWHRTVEGHSPATLTVHWRMWRRRDALDRLLADGAHPDSSPELALRARLLTGRSHRYRLAAEIGSIVSSADRREPTRLALDLCVEQVQQARGALLDIAARLCDEPCGARGVALSQRLLRDPGSPLYEPAAGDRLIHAVRAVAAALEHA